MVVKSKWGQCLSHQLNLHLKILHIPLLHGSFMMLFYVLSSNS
jgi:hypothetical protein